MRPWRSTVSLLLLAVWLDWLLGGRLARSESLLEYLGSTRHLLPAIGSQRCGCPLTSAMRSDRSTIYVTTVGREPAPDCAYATHEFVCLTAHHITSCRCTNHGWLTHTNDTSAWPERQEPGLVLGARHGYFYDWGAGHYCYGMICSHTVWARGSADHADVGKRGTAEAGLVQAEFNPAPQHPGVFDWWQEWSQNDDDPWGQTVEPPTAPPALAGDRQLL